MTNNNCSRVLLIYTGGTIGMGRNPKSGAYEPLDFNHLLQNLPEFRYVSAKVDIYSFSSPIDSSDMNPRMWAQIVRIISSRYDDYNGFVVLHGTDTMAFTASALSFMLGNLTKPVILTGSQLPIGQLRTDGKENLITSIEIAAACHADIVFHEEYIFKPDFSKPMKAHFAMDPNLVVFTIFPGIQETAVRHMLDIPELRSIVIRTYGSGNAPHQPWLIHLLKQTACRGVIIVNISQCAAGTVEMARYDNGFQLKNAGVVSGHDATIESTVTKLMHLQAHFTDNSTIRKYMNTSMRGEFTKT